MSSQFSAPSAVLFGWARRYASVKRAVIVLLGMTASLLSWQACGQSQDLGALLDSALTAQTAGKYGQAAALYRRATTISPGTAELWSNLGVMEFLTGELDPAAKDLRHALRLKPDLLASLLFLGKVYVQEGKPEQALPYLLRAQTLQSRDGEVLRSLGKTYESLHREREAALSYRLATEALPQDASAWLGLGSASLQLIALDGRTLATSAANSPWARALYADELLAQGRPLEATDTYNAVLASATPMEKAVLARMLAFMQYNPSQFPVPAKSQAALQHLVDLTQGVQSAAGQANVPVLCTERNHGQTASALIMDAACAFWARDYAQSATEAQEALRQSPKNTEALYWSVKANERIAVEALSRVDDLAPNSPASHDLVGDLYRYQQQSDNAILEYRKALTLDPHDAAALLGAAATYFSVSQYDEATAMVQKALADRPLDPKSNLLMAEILGAQGHESESLPYLIKCANIAPQFQARVHYLLGRAAAKDGNLQEAIHQFELALPGDEDGSTHYQLSRLYRKTGELAKAQTAEAEAKALVARRDANAAVALREVTATAP